MYSLRGVTKCRRSPVVTLCLLCFVIVFFGICTMLVISDSRLGRPYPGKMVHLHEPLIGVSLSGDKINWTKIEEAKATKWVNHKVTLESSLSTTFVNMEQTAIEDENGSLSPVELYELFDELCTDNTVLQFINLEHNSDSIVDGIYRVDGKYHGVIGISGNISPVPEEKTDIRELYTICDYITITNIAVSLLVSVAFAGVTLAISIPMKKTPPAILLISILGLALFVIAYSYLF